MWTAEIKIDGVSKQMSGRQILSGVSFDIGSGECVGLVGPNGAGKTSLIRCMLGLYASEGKILYDGTDVKNIDPPKSKIFFLLDNFGLFKDLNVHDNLEFYYRVYNGPQVDKTEMEEKIAGILDEIKLTEYSGESVKSLSKGMKQRLCIGRIMVSQASVLILDEPFTALDVEGQLFMIDRIKKFKAAGTTVLISSHDLGHLQQICDSVVFIKEGKVLKKAAFTENDRLESIYIDLFLGNIHERGRRSVSDVYLRSDT